MFPTPISWHTISFTFLKLEFDINLEFDIKKVTLLDASVGWDLHKYSSSYDSSNVLTISSPGTAVFSMKAQVNVYLLCKAFHRGFKNETVILPLT